MELIGRNHNLFEQLKSSIYIISSSIKGFNVFKNNKDELIIDFDFELLYGSDRFLKLRFVGVKEYSFYWNSTCSFYNVETYKLIMKDDLYYISFNPEDESSPDISESDEDLILFESFEGYYTNSC